MMMDSDPADAEIADTLKELVQQADWRAEPQADRARASTSRCRPTSSRRPARSRAPRASICAVDGDLNVQIACVLEEGEAIDGTRRR